MTWLTTRFRRLGTHSCGPREQSCKMSSGITGSWPSPRVTNLGVLWNRIGEFHSKDSKVLVVSI